MAVEDSFKCTKGCLGWEAVQVTGVAASSHLRRARLGAAGFLDALGVTPGRAEVWVLARFGGWLPQKDRPSGKITLTRGLGRLIEMLTTEAILMAYWKKHGAFAPKLVALLRGWKSSEEL